MPTFIEKSNCRGNKPAKVVGMRHNLRSELVGRLLKDRHVARFLIAPTGYGKSSIAYEYAHIVFGFRHVFWIPCDSPCFLRDLDSGSLATQIAKADPEAALAVFEDVPLLDGERASRFSGAIGSLLESGCEVVSTCVPSSDTFSTLQERKILLGPRDLLLSDDEMEFEKARAGVPNAEEPGVHSRIPCMAWGGGDEGVGTILRGMRREELDSGQELAFFTMLVLGDGTFEELGRVVDMSAMSESIRFLESGYPHLGIDSCSESFSAMKAAPDEALELTGCSATALSEASLARSYGELCDLLAEILLSRGDVRRACETVEKLHDKGRKAAWTACCGWDVLHAANPLSIDRMLDRSGAGTTSRKGVLHAMWGWAKLMLDDPDDAVSTARKVKSGQCSPEARAAAESLLAWTCPKHPLEEDLVPSEIDSDEGMAEHVGRMRQLEQERMRGRSAGLGANVLFDWTMLLFLERSRRSGWEAFDRAFSRVESACAQGDMPRCCRSAVMAEGARVLDAAVSEDQVSKAARVVQFMMSSLDLAAQEGAYGWPEQIATRSLEALMDAHPFAFDAAPSHEAVALMRGMEVSLAEQQRERRRRKALRAGGRRRMKATLASAASEKSRMDAEEAIGVQTPTLSISLFGGLDIRVGSDGEDMRMLRRRNAKVLLAILVLSRGREVARETLARELWPQASVDASIKNLYVIWSHVKKELSIGGVCPYLIRTQTGYRLDSRRAVSDVETFEELCNNLMFGKNELVLWEDLFQQATTDFAGDLLPEVRDCPFVETKRWQFRTRLADGLVSASGRMVQEGECRGAIWFAREALRRDRTREDAYIALMEGQIASNQRGAALDTYFECRKTLSDELGIDPSPKVMELYRSIIEIEEEF